MMRPEVARGGQQLYLVRYGERTLRSELIDEEVTSSPAAYPPTSEAGRADVHAGKVLPPKVERLQTRTWTNFKAW